MTELRARLLEWGYGRTNHGGRGTFSGTTPVFTGRASQMRIVPSELTARIRDPSGLQLAERTTSVGDLRARTSAPLAASSTIVVPSGPGATSREPSAFHEISPRSVRDRVARCVPLWASQILPPATRRDPSGLQAAVGTSPASGMARISAPVRASQTAATIAGRPPTMRSPEIMQPVRRREPSGLHEAEVP